MIEMICFLRCSSITVFRYGIGSKDLRIVFKNFNYGYLYEYLRDESNRSLHDNFKEKIEYV